MGKTLMLRLPPDAKPDGNLNLPRYAKKLLLEAMSAAEETGRSHLDKRSLMNDSQKCYIALSLGEEARLQAIQQQNPGADEEMSAFASKLIAGMLHPQAAAAPERSETRTLDMLIQKGVIHRRSQQITAYHHIRHALFGHRIGLTEAPTGVGKTIAYLSAARDVATEKQERVVIAFPRIALIEQCLLEWRNVMQAVDASQPAFILGKGEYVCVNALTAMMEDDDAAELPDVAKVRQWVRKGGPAAQHAALQGKWLVKSLAEIAPDFPAPTLLHEKIDADDEGNLAYESQFQQSLNASIIFVTHAMLASEVKFRYLSARREFGPGECKRLSNAFFETAREEREYQSADSYLNDQLAEIAESSRLPDFGYLIIDEVHTVEQAFSLVLSHDLSFFTLRSKLKACAGVKHAPSALVQANAVFAGLRRLAASTDSIDLKDSEYASLVAEIDALGKRVGKIDMPFAQYASRTIGAMRSMLQLRSAVTGIVYSPTEKFPSLRVGLGKVTPYLDFLWSMMKGVSLVSATVSLPKPNGGDSDWYMRRILGLDHDRSDRTDFACVSAPPWLTNPVTLMVPRTVYGGEGQRPFLRPISRSDAWERESEEDKWYDEVSATINFAARSAAGGMLVLCTSYDAIANIKRRLEGLADRLVTATRSVGAHQQKLEYIGKYDKGVKPIWLATGSAWTGLDLRTDGRPDEDLLLTDLVIPRLPFSMNKSVTHYSRMESQKRMGFVYESFEMGYLTKQGMGRLVRREGIQQNRRLWLLDARINDPKMAGMTGIVKAMFNRYNDPMEICADSVMKGAALT